MHEISTLRTDVKERPSFLTANVILFFLGGVCEQNTLNLYLCNDGITRFWKNGDGQRFSVIRKDPPTMIVTLKIEVAVMELLWLGSTIISFHQRKAKLPCCTLHHHTSCNCVRLVVILIVVFPPATRRRGAAAQLEGTGVSAPSDNRESGAGGIPWSDLNVFGGGQRWGRTLTTWSWWFRYCQCRQFLGWGVLAVCFFLGAGLFGLFFPLVGDFC